MGTVLSSSNLTVKLLALSLVSGPRLVVSLDMKWYEANLSKSEEYEFPPGLMSSMDLLI